MNFLHVECRCWCCGDSIYLTYGELDVDFYLILQYNKKRNFLKEIKIHMKQNRTFIFITLLLTILGLSACSSQKQQLVGKYIDIYDENHYLYFSEDNTFVDNFLTTTSEGNTDISDFYIYQIDNDGFITIISKLKYEFQDSLDKYELGWLCDEKIGIWLDGSFPTNGIETSISCSLNGYEFKYHFKNDKSYEHTITSNNEIIHTEKGTYSINGNEVICTSEDGIITTFINVEDKVFCIEYVKE